MLVVFLNSMNNNRFAALFVSLLSFVGLSSLQGQNLAVSIQVQNHPTCFQPTGGQLSASALGGTAPYTFQWFPGGVSGATVLNLGQGTYRVRVTDAAGDTASSSLYLTKTSGIQIQLTQSQSVLCYGGNTGSLTALATGTAAAFSYRWIGPDAGTSGANRIGSALQLAANANGNVRIASWDPIAGICAVPGRCSDGWLAGNYAVVLSANAPVVRSEPLQMEVAETAERYPLPPPSRLWFVVVDSANTAAAAGEKSLTVARQSRTTSNPSIFTWKGKWAVGLFGLGDPAVGEAVAGIVQEDLPRAVFGRDDRRYESFQEWSNWTKDPEVVASLVAWRRANPARNVRLLVYGTTENTTTNRTQFNAFVAQLNEQLQRERLEPFALVFERLDPHAESCADGCEHANKPYNRLVLLVTKPQ